jgi:hypothetical protein
VKVDAKFGGQWKIPCLVVHGMWRKNTFSPLPIPLNNFTLNLQIFLLTLRFYFTMVLSFYSRLSFLFFDL